MISRKIFLIALSLAIISLSLNAHAGKMYNIIGVYDIVQGKKFQFDGNIVEVIEFMSFSCRTCYEFEQSIPVIKGNFPGKIQWKFVPIYWQGHGSPKPGEAYFIAEEMGKGKAMKKALFDAHMVQKKNISDIEVLEGIGKDLGLGSDFSKKLRAGEKAKDVQNALDMIKAYRVNETPSIVIAGNIITNPHQFHHDLDTFRVNIILIIKSLFKEYGKR